MGENVARQTILMFITNTILKFRFEKPDGEELPDAEPVGGLTIGPKPFRAKVVPIIK